MDFNTIMNLAANMQDRLSKSGGIKEQLKKIQVSVSVGGGVVSLQMDGLYTVLQLDIQSDLLNPQEKSGLQDLLTLGFNQAIEQVRSKQKETLKDLGIPLELLGQFL